MPGTMQRSSLAALPPHTSEIVASTALVPLSVLCFEWIFEGAALLSKPDPYALIAAAVFQSLLLLRSANDSRSSLAVHHLSGFAIYAMAEVMFEGWSFFDGPQHVLYGAYSVLFAALASMEGHNTGRTALIMADSFVRATVPLTMYAACAAADRRGVFDWSVFGDSRANTVLLINAVLLGVLLGLARASRIKTRAYLTDAIQSMGDGLALFDHKDRLVICNQAYAEKFGAGDNPQTLAGKHIEAVVRLRLAVAGSPPKEFPGSDEDWVRERVRQHREADGTSHFHVDEGGHWIRIVKRRTHDGGVVGVYSDVTQLKRAAESAQSQAQHDPLTGLPNRRLLPDRLALTMAHARRDGAMAALLVIDLDRFKQINDIYGHQAGDEVLRAVALRLSGCIREIDTALRVGGDEFIVLLGGIAQTEDAGAVAEKIVHALAQPLNVAGLATSDGDLAEVHIGSSIGISLYPRNGAAQEPLLRQADQAMYRAKSAGGGYRISDEPAAAQPGEAP